MKEVIDFLTANNTGFLGTVEGDKPHVRPFQFMLEDGGKLFFCTSNKKDVYAQLKANPHFEFSNTSPNFEWIRVRGEAEFCDDLSIKEKIIDSGPLVKSIYQSASNPIFEIFFIKNGHATIADFSGQPPKVYEL